jgi:hypothetical protein
MFALNGADLAIAGSTLGVAALFATLARAVMRTAIAETDPPRPGTAKRETSATTDRLVVGVPSIWCGLNDPEQTRRAAGIMQRIIATIAPGVAMEIRFTIDSWEWRCPKEMPAHQKERIEMAMHLLAIRWRRIEEDSAVQVGDRAHLIRQWEELALRFSAHGHSFAQSLSPRESEPLTAARQTPVSRYSCA